MKDVYWGGAAGTKPDVYQLTEQDGGDSLRPYGPEEDRWGEVTILSTNVRQRTLKSLAIMSPLGTMFVHEGTERSVSWRQTVRAEVIATSICIQVQRYPMFARFVAVVGVAHEGDRQSVYRRRQSVFGYDTAKYRPSALVHR